MSAESTLYGDEVTVDLLLKLRSEADGGVAYEFKETLVSLTAQGDEIAARGLEDYALTGQHDHIREFITCDLSELTTPGDQLGPFFLQALMVPVCSYWASTGAIRALGRKAYPKTCDICRRTLEQA